MLKKSVIALSFAILTGCGGGSSSNNDSPSNSGVEAPDSIRGLSFRHSVNSGTGGFAETGEYVATASSTGNTYVIAGDVVNVDNSSGTYTYSKNGNLGTIVLNDIILSNIECLYTFSTTTSGSYVCESLQFTGVKQSGTFTNF